MRLFGSSWRVRVFRIYTFVIESLSWAKSRFVRYCETVAKLKSGNIPAP